MKRYKYQALVRLYPVGDSDPNDKLGPSPRRVIVRATCPRTHHTQMFCALVSCDEAESCKRGNQSRVVTLRLADDADVDDYLQAGAHFDVWLGGDIGHGRVTRRLFV